MNGYTAIVRPVTLIVTLLALCGPAAGVAAQTRPTTTARKPAAQAKPTLKTEPAALACPSPLGTGVTTKREFCDVPIGRTPADGIAVKLPAYRGTAFILFDLHSRQTYSEDQVRARNAFVRATATLGVLTMDNTLVSRAVIQTEFRTAADLFDRIGGGAGPSGLKAVAPAGVESVRIELPKGATEVCILGEKLLLQRFEGAETFVAPGRPIALISNVMIEYEPVPAKRAPVRRAPVKKAPAAGTSR